MSDPEAKAAYLRSLREIVKGFEENAERVENLAPIMSDPGTRAFMEADAEYNRACAKTYKKLIKYAEETL